MILAKGLVIIYRFFPETLSDYFTGFILRIGLMMPGIDGFETCRRLKAIPITQDIPIIFLTALADTVDKVTGFKIGAVDYITKPIQHEEVLSRIYTHLTIRNLQKELQEKNKELALLNYNLEALVETKNKQLIQQEKTAIIGRLTQGIIHNLKTPLQTIFYIEILPKQFQWSILRNLFLFILKRWHKQLNKLTN